MANNLNRLTNHDLQTSASLNRQDRNDTLNPGNNRLHSLELNSLKSPNSSSKRLKIFSRFTKSFDNGIDQIPEKKFAIFSPTRFKSQRTEGITRQSSEVPTALNNERQNTSYQSEPNTYENSRLNQAQQAQSYNNSGERQELDTYYQDESRKKLKISTKIDRFVQRFPVFSKFYKQPPTSFDQQESYEHITPIVNQFHAEKSVLDQRYLDKTRNLFINLSFDLRSQPIDVCINRKQNKIYLCDLGRSVVEIYDICGILLHQINDATINNFQPTAITVAAEGTIILSSHFSHCLHMHTPQFANNLIDTYSYKQFKLGTPGDGIHQFYNPAGIVVDQTDGYLYICDRGNSRIQVIRPEGMCERVIQLYTDDKRKYLVDPRRIAIQYNRNNLVCILGDGDLISIIPKYSNGRIYVEPFYVLDENGLGLENASGIATDSHDRIFISDTNHHRIVICSPDGFYITSIGTEGNGQGQLKRPCGLDLTEDGTILVTDPGNLRLQLIGIEREERVNNENDSIPMETDNRIVNSESDRFVTL